VGGNPWLAREQLPLGGRRDDGGPGDGLDGLDGLDGPDGLDGLDDGVGGDNGECR